MLRVKGRGGKYGREKKATFNEVNFLLILFTNSEVRLGDKNLDMYLHGALQITKPFHIPLLFELCGNSETIRA